MGLLTEIKARLAALTPTVGTIYLGAMPATPDAAVVVYAYGGAPPDLGFGVAGIAHETPGVHIEVRGAAQDYVTPEALIKRIWLDLAKVQGMALSGTTYLMLSAVQSPFLQERDANQRCIFGVNFLANKVPS